jgi:hypothetical protein
MAWIAQKRRSGGGTSAVVRWRVGGTRSGRTQTEIFGAGSDDQSLARAEGFKRMVDAAGLEDADVKAGSSPLTFAARCRRTGGSAVCRWS